MLPSELLQGNRAFGRFVLMTCPKGKGVRLPEIRKVFKEKTGIGLFGTFETETQFIAVWDRAERVSTEDGKVHLILLGEVFGTDLKQMLARYLSAGNSFVKELNGSFAVIVIDLRNDRVELFTDRLNSKRILATVVDDMVWVSDSIYMLSVAPAVVDKAALAWYLANGAVYNNRTFIRDIRVLDRACAHTVCGARITTSKYWSYTFPKDEGHKNEDELKPVLSDILVSSVEKRLNSLNGRDVYLTLTGGYDSTALLGILRKKFGIDNLKCFTFTFDDTPRTDSDEYVARSMANLYDVKHTIMEGYRGDTQQFIEVNALLSNGYAPMVAQIDTYMDLRKSMPLERDALLFTGDILTYGYQKRDMHKLIYEKEEDILLTSFLYDFGHLGWMKGFLSDTAFDGLCTGLREDLCSVLEKIPRFEDVRDRIDYLWLDQKLTSVSLPWKQNFPGNFMAIKTPFVDNAIIDFYGGISADLRHNKHIYIQTISSMFPELFAIDRSQVISFPDWTEIVNNGRGYFEHFGVAGNSPLDNYFSPDILKSMLAYNSRIDTRDVTTSVGNKVDDYTAFDKVFRSKDISFILLRLFTARQFLRYFESGPSPLD